MIMLARSTDPGDELVMYPQLRGYQPHCQSSEFRVAMQLLDFDILKRCPADQVWPWCACCRKIFTQIVSITVL